VGCRAFSVDYPAPSDYPALPFRPVSLSFLANKRCQVIANDLAIFNFLPVFIIEIRKDHQWPNV